MNTTAVTRKRKAAIRLVVAGLIVGLSAASSAPAGPQEIADPGTPTFMNLAIFNGSNGADPLAPLVQGTDGEFYGTTSSGGGGLCGGVGCGTIFKISAAGVLTVLHKFDGNDGSFPSAGLVQATDGNFYGTTEGSSCENGYSSTAFKMTPSGTLTTLANLDGCPGPLIQATDGNFYGITSYGGYGIYSDCGKLGCGTVFRMTPSGTVGTLYSFCSQTNCTDGNYPVGGLVQATNGNFYGVTEYGGVGDDVCPGDYPGCGTVFEITPSGALTIIYSFCPQGNCATGAQPLAGLVQAKNGNLYGPSVLGVFEITPSGTLVRNISTAGVPNGPLVQATDGNLYGTNSNGGTNSDGTIFKFTPTGTLTVLHNFANSPASTPMAGLIQATGGNFYGTASMSANGGGTVFRLAIGLGPFVETRPTSGAVGTPVTILGNKLMGTSSVTFNGTPATFNVVSNTEITTTVPAGATTGEVNVKTPSGTLSSNVPFRVTQ